MTGAVATVAKKKTESKKKPGPKPSPDGPRGSIVTMKCHDDFKDWLNRFAKTHRSTPSQMIELGLVELAKVRGFEEPPGR